MKAAVLVLLMAAPLAFAFDWPLREVVLTATFGESRGDHFHTGVDLGGGGQEVRPIAAGEVVFAYEEGVDFSSRPVGLGSFVVLQHQGRVRSIYSHLQAGSLAPGEKSFDGSRPLGIVGATGYSLGRHLHLTLIDSEMRSLINPLAVLPSVPDRQAPVIREVLLRTGREPEPAVGGMSVKPGTTEVLVRAYDLRADVAFAWKMAVHRLSLYQDGREVAVLRLDGLHEQLGKTGAPELVLLESNRGFRAVFEAEWVLRLGEVKLIPGQTTLTVFAADFAGNESSRELRLNVSD